MPERPRERRAPKRALEVLEAAEDCKGWLRIVRLIQQLLPANVFGSAAVREASAAERFLARFGIVPIPVRFRPSPPSVTVTTAVT